MISKLAVEIANDADIPVLLKELEREYERPITFKIWMDSHNCNWRIKAETIYYDPHDDYFMKTINIFKILDRNLEKQFIDYEIRNCIRKLLEYVNEIEGGKSKIKNN